MLHSTPSIRNLALAGHAGAGKTTLFEALLHAGGVIPTMGSVERGTTVSDTDALEQAHGHSIDSAIATIDHGGCHINLVDTAGSPDFLGGTLATLAAVDTVAVVVNATAGIEHGTRRLMEHAQQRGLARMIIVNKIDFEGARLGLLVDALREEFGSECLPINLPAQGGRRVIDCFFHDNGATDFSSPAAAHQQLIDQVVEIDETVMGAYLDNGEAAVTPQQLHDAFEQCLREGHLVPICFVSARTGVGVPALLEVIERLLPNPTEANSPAFLNGDGKHVTFTGSPTDHVIADVFKIINDPVVGKLGVFRVWQGTLSRDSELFIDDGRKPFKATHLFRLHGKAQLDVDALLPGDIGALTKVEEIHFDAVLHDSHDEDHIALAPVPFPQPVFALALEPLHKNQEQKVANALARLAEEDPCFRVEHHKESNETVVCGLSDLHLKVMLARMKERYGAEVVTHPPRVVAASAAKHG